MRISIISFTEKGKELSVQLKKKLEAVGLDCSVLYTKRRKSEVEVPGDQTADDAEKQIMEKPEMKYVTVSLQQWTKEQFAQRRPILFIGACGIAVRAVAPHLKSKLTDSPVLVIDEAGQYVIPILSGHAGGANELARMIAQLMNAEAVITTATDVQRCFAIDVFAVKNHLQILKKNQIAAISGKLLSGEQVTVAIEGVGLTKHIEKSEQEKIYEKELMQVENICDYKMSARLPEGLLIRPYPPEEKTDVVISREDGALAEAVFPLKPKEYIVGIGCRKGKPAAELEDFFLHQLEKNGLSAEDIFAIASIDRKKDEEAICLLSEKYRIPYVTFSKEKLQQVEGEFHGSAFVESQVGVDNVCERAALAACEESIKFMPCEETLHRQNGNLILQKQAECGMTLAIARRNWSYMELDWS